MQRPKCKRRTRRDEESYVGRVRFRNTLRVGISDTGTRLGRISPEPSMDVIGPFSHHAELRAAGPARKLNGAGVAVAHT